MADAPRPGAGRRAQADQIHITIEVDGESFTMRPTELSALDSAALRRETGLSVRHLLQAAKNDMDLDVIAAIVWLARRQAGDKTKDGVDYTFAEIAEGIGYETPFETISVPVEADPSTPEA